MLFQIRAFIYSLFFLVSLEAMVFWQAFWWGALLLFLFTLVFIWPLVRKPRFLFISFFLSLGSVNLTALIDQGIEKHVFIFIASLVHYISLVGAYRLKNYRCDQSAQGMIEISTLVASFFWFISIFGWFLNFQVEAWCLVLVIMLSAFLINLPSFLVCVDSINKLSEKKQLDLKKQPFIKALFLNLVLVLIVGEVVWAVTFWPFSYLTTGTIVLVVFYSFRNVILLFIREDFSLKRVAVGFVGGAVFILGLLLTAQWNLIV